MSCTDCFNGCGAPTPDNCVKYTGESVESLGIQSGDPLSKVEEILINKLVEYAQGQGIVLNDIDLKCNFFETILGCCKDKSLMNIIQALIDANCKLYELYEDLGIDDPFYVFTLGCLVGEVPADPSRDDIIQGLINKLCNVSIKVDFIYNDYVKASQLNSLIASYLTGAGLSAQQYTRMVPYVAYEYYGSLSNFSGSGAGLAAFGFDKVYLCSGQTVNGYTLPDKRGRVAVGVPSQPGGGALPAAVDYALPINAGCNYTLKQQFGLNFNQLTIPQLPSHTHTPTVTDLKHSHLMASTTNLGGTLTGATPVSSYSSTSVTFGYSLSPGATTPNVGKSGDSFSNISVSIANTGNGTPVDNRQPSVAAYYIMYIP